MATITDRLYAAVAAVCPIVSVAIGTPGVSASVRVTFAPAATPAQQSAAQNAVSSFDWSASADAAYGDSLEPDLAAMRDQAQAALDNNATYLALTSPTNAQVVAQVKALTQQNQRIIKALARIVLTR